MGKCRCWYCNEVLKPVKLTIKGIQVDGFGCYNQMCLSDRSMTTVIYMDELAKLEEDK